MKRIALCVALVSFTSLAAAQVQVKDPWVRATVPQQKATGAYMQLTSPKDARLVEARSPVAGVVELHEMVMEKDIMKMRPVRDIKIPAGGAAELKPGGYHVMLMELKQQIKEGDKVPLTLVVEGPDGKRDTLQVTAIARPLTAAGPAHGMPKH
jgi:copper(I)-binding protein